MWDGEVEDHMVPLIAGDASISGYKFGDLNGNGIWEPQGAFQAPPVQFASPGGGAIVVVAGDDVSSSWIEFSNDPMHACQTLVNAANDAGGEDNIGVIVAKVT